MARRWGLLAVIGMFSVALLTLRSDPDAVALGQTAPPFRHYQPVIAKALPPTSTPTATNTPTPTLTPTLAPTRTPTPTLTPIPAGFHLVESSVQHMPSSPSYIYILGDLFNNGQTPIGSADVRVDFFNGAGAFIDTDTGYTFELIPPGRRGCFWIIASPPTGWASYRVRLIDFRSSTRALVELPLSNVLGRAISGGYEIVGQVTNNGPARTSSVGVYATLYGAGGKVVGCESTSIPANEMGAGQTGSFKMWSHFTPPSAVVSFDVRTRG